MYVYLDGTRSIDLDSIDGTSVDQWLDGVFLKERTLEDCVLSWRADGGACKQGGRSDEGAVENEVGDLHDERWKLFEAFEKNEEL